MEALDLLNVLLLVVGATAVAAIARRYGASSPLALVFAGFVVSFIPGVPDYELDPHIVLLLFLPPLLYSAALESSVVNIKRSFRPIALLSVGLVLFTTGLVGYFTYRLVPGLTLPAAFALGAIVAPPDAVAATAIGRRLGLPRRLVTILAGESLLNDATALTAYRVAVAAATGATVSYITGIRDFAWAAFGGVLIGLVLAKLVGIVQRHIRDAVVENALALLTPFVGYVIAEELHASGVLTVVAAGLYLGHQSSRQTYAARLQSGSLWRMVDFILESIVFAFIGLQLPVVIEGLSGRDPVRVTVVAAGLSLLVIVARIVWVFPGTFLPLQLSARIREREGVPSWRGVAVVSWSGMRGVVSLAAAFALPRDFPERPLILFLTFVVVIVTLVVQGATLPYVIKWLGVTGTDSREDDLAEAQAKYFAARDSLARLNELIDAPGANVDEDVVSRLRANAEHRSNWAWERVGGPVNETPAQSFKRLRREMLTTERQVFVQLRDDGRLEDEVLRRLLLELDLEEAILDRE